MNVRLTCKASSDLDGIYEHYRELLGADQAKGVVHDVVLESKVLNRPRIIDNSRPTEVPAVRELVLRRWPFLTSFHVSAGTVEILRFLHRDGESVPQSVSHTPAPPLSAQEPVQAQMSAGLRTYDKTVDGITYSVPRGISREARGEAWIVRATRDKQLIMSERFSDTRFGGTSKALEVAIGHLIHCGHAWLESDVLRLDERATVHWRKRSGVGLCAVAYVTNKGPGRGKTFFLSTHKRVASGRGMDKFSAKLIEVLENAYKTENEVSNVPYSSQKRMRSDVEQLLKSEVFKTFLEAGNRKADQIAVSQYLEQMVMPAGTYVPQ